MKYFRYATVAFFLFFAVHRLVGQEHQFGVGVMIGEPAGISAKLWTSPVHAFDFGLGWSVGGDRIGRYDKYYYGENRVHMHIDYLWYAFDIIKSSERFPVYYGFGGRINNGGGQAPSIAIRGVVGFAWLPRKIPIDIFIELVPMIQITTSSGIGLDAGVGIRYFF